MTHFWVASTFSLIYVFFYLLLSFLDGFLGLFPVGRFNLNGSGLPTLQLNQDLIWPDPNNLPPVAVPVCGFQV